MTDVALEPRARRAGGNRGPALAGSLRQTVFGLIGLAILVGVWELVVAIGNLSQIVLPSPVGVGSQFGTMLSRGDFWHSLEVSVSEFACGFALGVVCGILIGLAMNEFRVVGMTLSPVIESLRFVVPFAWIPLAVLWFGTSFWGKVFLVSYAVFFVMVVSTIGMVRQVEPSLSAVGTMLGMKRLRLATTVRLRAAGPALASAARAAAATGWIAVVAAEYIGSSSGVGFIVINAEQTLQTDTVIAGMIVIGLVGAAVSAVIGWGARRWLRYG